MNEKETTYQKNKRRVRELEDQLHKMTIAFKNYINAKNFGACQQTFDDLEKWFAKNTRYKKTKTEN